jgi:hypothetical protein
MSNDFSYKLGFNEILKLHIILSDASMIRKCHESVKRLATNRKYHHLLLIWRVLVRFLRRSTFDGSLCSIIVDGALTKKIEPRVSGSI